LTHFPDQAVCLLRHGKFQVALFILNKLRQYLTDNSTSMKKVFSQLSNIAVISGHNDYRFTKTLSKKQKKSPPAWTRQMISWTAWSNYHCREAL